jgi:hypothetical protein
MNATMLTTLIVATAVVTLAWMIWQKKHKQPFMARWLLTVGLLLAPIFLAKWLAPAAWLDIRTMPDLFWYLTVLPFLVAVSSIGGGLLLFFGQILGAFFNVLGDAEWSGDDEDKYLGVAKAYDPYDFYNDWYYRFYRDDT